MRAKLSTFQILVLQSFFQVIFECIYLLIDPLLKTHFNDLWQNQVNSRKSKIEKIIAENSSLEKNKIHGIDNFSIVLVRFAIDRSEKDFLICMKGIFCVYEKKIPFLWEIINPERESLDFKVKVDFFEDLDFFFKDFLSSERNLELFERIENLVFILSFFHFNGNN